MKKSKPKCVIKAETFQGLNIYVPEDEEKAVPGEITTHTKEEIETTNNTAGSKVKKMGLD